MSSVATHPSAPTVPRDRVIDLTPAAALGGGFVLLAILVAVFWHFLRTQVGGAIAQPSDWGHTLVIPFISAWFVWLRRDQLLAKPFRPAWTGIAVIAIGLGWYCLALLGPANVNHHNLRGFGVGATLAGICLLLFGWRSMRWLWFPIVYWVIFGQTVSEQALQIVTLRLQDWAAIGAHVFLNGIGFETERNGNMLTLITTGGEHPLNVAEACSGMRMLVAFLALGVAMAYVGLDRWWQRVALVIMGVPIAIAVNILRVATLGILSLRDANMIQGEFHLFVGMVWLVPAFVMYLGVQWCLRALAQPWTVTEKTGANAR